MSKLNSIVAFTLGAAVGSLITWKVLKNHYENEVLEVFPREEEETEDDEQDENPVRPSDKPDLMEYAAKIKEAGYVNYSNETKSEKVEENNVSVPYIIDEEDFGELDGYEAVTMEYYSDGTLCDPDGKPIPKEENEDVLGSEAVKLLESGEDSVYIRDDGTKMDMEILLNLTPYEE